MIKKLVQESFLTAENARTKWQSMSWAGGKAQIPINCLDKVVVYFYLRLKTAKPFSSEIFEFHTYSKLIPVMHRIRISKQSPSHHRLEIDDVMAFLCPTTQIISHFSFNLT